MPYAFAVRLRQPQASRLRPPTTISARLEGSGVAFIVPDPPVAGGGAGGSSYIG